MKFIADAMLGSLAKRLRLLGYDVVYDSTLDDNSVIRVSLEQHRVILTRDLPLTRRPLAANHLFIKDQDVKLQVDQVVTAFPPSTELRKLTRCSRCNGRLRDLPRSKARDFVPDHVYQQQTRFWKCEACGRIYWRGSHVDAMGLSGEQDSE